MKKLLYQKILIDNLRFFLIISISISSIVWVIQAVQFLDFVTEDGHGLLVYFYYSILNFPKIIHRIFPFAFFISVFYQIYQYEMKNELLVYWTHGMDKKNFTNTILTYSLLILITQILLGSILSPMSQHKARSFIRNSNIDFFPSLIKEGKFIDTVSNLTIFIESKDAKGKYKNIFLKDSPNQNTDKNSSKSQVIYAKRGILINNENGRYFELEDGRVINRAGSKITNFTFEKIDFNLNKFYSKSTVYPKIQEAETKDLAKCLYYNYKNKIENFKADYLRCTNKSLPNIKQEFLKRVYKPIYIPLIALISCLLIIQSKENTHYNRYKFFLFIFAFSVIVVSEISLRYSSNSNMGSYLFYLIPILLFFLTYMYLITKLKNNN